MLKDNFPFLTGVTSDYSAERLAVNQEMATRIISLPSTVAYDPVLGWADAVVAVTDVHVTIDRHIGVPLTFNSNQIQGTIRDLFGEQAPAAAAGLARDMVAALYALITPAHFANAAAVCDLATFGRAAVVDLGTALTKRQVPMGADNRTLLLNADYFGQLSKDTSLVTVVNGGPEGDRERGTLTDVGGFKVVCAATLPTTGNLCGFAFSRSALVIATRLAGDYTKALPGASYGNAYVVTEPQTGISVQVVEYVGHTAGTATRRLSLMFGVAVGNANAGQILSSK